MKNERMHWRQEWRPHFSRWTSGTKSTTKSQVNWFDEAYWYCRQQVTVFVWKSLLLHVIPPGAPAFTWLFQPSSFELYASLNRTKVKINSTTLSLWSTWSIIISFSLPPCFWCSIWMSYRQFAVKLGLMIVGSTHSFRLFRWTQLFWLKRLA